MSRSTTIEVCCGSVDDVLEAEKAGADRAELNSALFFGGLTPSIGEVIESKKLTHIPIMAMIRPRGGGFCYTDNEFRVMLKDAETVLNNGADGIVFGVLTEDGKIDIERNKKLVEIAGSKEAVFHRAFDTVPDPFEALEILIDIGIKRILTKGQENTIEEGLPMLKKLMEKADGRIKIMPSGCKVYNADWVVNELKCNEIHIASYETKVDKSTLSRPHVYFGSALRPPECTYDLVSYSFVKAIREKVQLGGDGRNEI